MIHTTRFAQSIKWIHVLVGRLSNRQGGWPKQYATPQAITIITASAGFFLVRFAITTAQNLKRFALMMAINTASLLAT
jgi:hypothetical protein